MCRILFAGLLLVFSLSVSAAGFLVEWPAIEFADGYDVHYSVNGEPFIIEHVVANELKVEKFDSGSIAVYVVATMDSYKSPFTDFLIKIHSPDIEITPPVIPLPKSVGKTVIMLTFLPEP